MKRTRNFLYALGLGIASMIAMPVASAQSSPQDQSPTTKDETQPGQGQQGKMGAHDQGAQSMKMAKRMSGTATVEKIDKAKRHLTLRDENGKEFSVEVPQSVKRFDEIQQGDRIKVDYYQSVALSMKKSEAGAQPGGRETTMMERNAGKLPSGEIAHQVTGTVEIVNVDKANNQVTVRKPNGDMDTIDVKDPQVQAQLDTLKAGDKVQVTYTEAAAITVMREGKGGEKGTQGTYQNEQEQQQPGMGGEKGTSGQQGQKGQQQPKQNK